MVKSLLIPILIGLILGACATKTPPNSADVVQVAGEFGCDDLETRIFDRLIEGSWSDPALDRKALTKMLSENARGRMSEAAAADYGRMMKFLLEDAPSRTEEKDLRLLYADFEAGHVNRSTDDMLSRDYAKLRREVWPAIHAENSVCQASPRKERPNSVTASTAGHGMRWTFATAYQSCDVLNQPALRASDPDVQGIKAWCCHPDGIGFKREITNMSSLAKTHPYAKAPSDPVACVDVSKSPMIYNYGGKPFPDDQSLDLRKPSGDGTSVLGIDCSAYVSTAYETAGLKLSTLAPLRPMQAQIYSSGDFLHPEDDGLNCLERVTMTPKQGLQDGDIIAIQGHVVMVDQVGRDPFRIEGIRTAEECRQITPAQFKFDIYQSSNSKNGVGLNRFKISEYLKTTEHDTMKKGLLEYAIAACESRVGNKAVTPMLESLAIVRHTGTEICKDARVPLAHEACVQSCFAKSSM